MKKTLKTKIAVNDPYDTVIQTITAMLI